MAENYDLIFGQSASSQYAWSDSDYQNGWQTVGSTPPTAEQFDALQRKSDTKAKDLNDRLSPLETKAEADGRQAATSYASGAMLTVDGLPNGWLLECITPGISGTDVITLPDTLIDGLTIIDGNVTWALRKVATNSGIGYRQPSAAYAVGNIAYHASLPAGWCLKCTTGGTTSAGDITPSSTIGDTVTDGTVTWTVVKYALTTDVPPLASALATPRKIKLTGNASGSAAFDGSGDVSINVTVNESKHAVNADVAKTLETTDANGVKSNGKFYWIGKGGQPMWLWGSNTKPSETYTYNPSNFHVAKADTATTADNSNKLGGYPLRPHASGGHYGNIPFVETNGVMEVGRYIDWHATEGGTEDHSSRWEAQNNGTVSVGTINGTLNGNAATASKLATARAISLTGNASGSANFDGSGNISINTTVSRASVADVVHKAIQPRGVYKIENYIFYGTLTIPQNGDFFKLEVLGGSGHNSQIEQSREGTLYFRTGNGDPVHYAAYSEYHRNGASDFKFFIVKDSGTQYRIYGGPTSYTGTMQIIPYIGQDSSFELALNDASALPNGAVEVEQQQLIYASTVNNFAPTKTGGGASGTWGINISGNAASAGNADTVDGYHASDLLRTLGGNRTPVMTDIFDRAGTIDLTALSAADKARHKALINKSQNASQNLWDNTTGIHAYGGGVDMANGYAQGTLKLTQSYKNFDKILVVACDSDAAWTTYRIWDTWELAHAFNSCFAFDIIGGGGGGIYWIFYGTQQHGTEKVVWSTDTIWNCYNQDGGIIAIYGIKY